MRKHRLILALLIVSTGICAQIRINGNLGSGYAKFSQIETLDKSTLEVIYEYHVKDTNLDETRTYFDILQLGNLFSKYFAYPTFQIDSVIYKKDITKITVQESGEIYHQYGFSSASSHMIIKDKATGELSFYDRIFTDNYVYNDEVRFKWSLINDTKSVCGYSCKKATAEFRGRQWTAWYSSEIPQSDGPWKFSGLPGLILQIEDEDNEHFFTAISIRNSKEDIYLTKKSYFSTNRQRFNKQIREFRTNPASVISGSQLAPKDNAGNEKPIAKRAMFFNPIELE